MRNRFKINESEKNRIRTLHGIGMLNEVESPTPEMIQGIDVTTLHPLTYDYLKGNNTITTAEMLKLIAGCYENEDMDVLYGRPGYDYRSDSTGGGKIMRYGDGRTGSLILQYANGQSRIWDNICGYPDQIYGEWNSLDGFNYDQDLYTMISEWWDNSDYIRNEHLDEDPDEIDGQARWETGQKLKWARQGNSAKWALVVK